MSNPPSVCSSTSSTSVNPHTEPLMSSWTRRKADKGEEEINELFRVFSKKWKNESRAARIAFDVEKVMAELELAAEDDAHLNWLGKPAVNKLKKLSYLTDVLAKKQLHHEFLDHGVLSLLKSWLEPLPDGNLPNINVRAAILNILDDLPIDLKQRDRREQLQRSGLGKVVMLLSKSDEETAANRKLAKKLADKWGLEDWKVVDEERVSRRPPVKKVATEGVGMCARDDHLVSAKYSQGSKSGEPSSSQHASRPKPVSMDFVVRPPSQVDPVAARIRAKQMARHQPRAKLNKKLQQMRAPKRKQLQAVKVNALGRGMADHL